MTNYATGHSAEIYASQYLQSIGYQIVDINWRTAWSEIDIIAIKNNCAVFVEVKYRKNELQGSGLDYITKTKLRKMTKAAESWVQTNNWTKPYHLAAIELSGHDYHTVNLIEDIILS